MTSVKRLVEELVVQAPEQSADAIAFALEQREDLRLVQLGALFVQALPKMAEKS